MSGVEWLLWVLVVPSAAGLAVMELSFRGRVRLGEIVAAAGPQLDPVAACAVIDCWDEGVWTERDGTHHCSAHVGRPTP